jgi:hypothetical protein
VVLTRSLRKRSAELDNGRLAYVPKLNKAGDEPDIFYGLTAPFVIGPVGTGRCESLVRRMSVAMCKVRP